MEDNLYLTADEAKGMAKKHINDQLVEEVLYIIMGHVRRAAKKNQFKAHIKIDKDTLSVPEGFNRRTFSKIGIILNDLGYSAKYTLENKPRHNHWVLFQLEWGGEKLYG